MEWESSKCDFQELDERKSSGLATSQKASRGGRK